MLTIQRYAASAGEFWFGRPNRASELRHEWRCGRGPSVSRPSRQAAANSAPFHRGKGEPASRSFAVMVADLDAEVASSLRS